jgi:hypothetical protein
VNTLTAAVAYDVTDSAVKAVESASRVADEKTASTAALALAIAMDSENEESARVAVLKDPRIARLSLEAAQAINDAAELAAWHPSPDTDAAVSGSVKDALRTRRTDAELADTIRSTVADAAAARRSTVETDDETPDAESRRHWSDAAGRTAATRLAAERVVESMPVVEEAAGVSLHKLWLTQADSRVRSSHRHLQGKTVEADKPFWRELGTDKQLRFPGDPEAPLDQTVNCRCFLWLVPADQAAAAEETFQISDDDYALAASVSRHPSCGLLHGNAALMTVDEFDGAADILYGLTAATERKYDESKHKRDKGGKFSKHAGQQGGTVHEHKRFDRKKWLAEGGWDRVRAKYGLGKGKGKGKGSGSGSGSGSGGGDSGSGDDVDAGKAFDDAAERARKRFETIQKALQDRRDEIENTRASNEADRRQLQAQADLEQITRREGEDAAMRKREQMVRDVEQDLRKHQSDVERSQNLILGMRLRGELPDVIEAERQKLLRLKGETTELVNLSRSLGTPDQVRDLRDRVRSSRRIQDVGTRNNRADLDRRIRLAQRRQDQGLRNTERSASQDYQNQVRDLRARANEARKQAAEAKRGRRASLVGGGHADSPQSCVIALIPKGHKEIEYESGEKAPAHLTLAYLSDGSDNIEDDFDAIDAAVARFAASRQPFTVTVAGRANLGEDGDDVIIVEASELAEARAWAESEPGISERCAASDHPHWIPHMTGVDGDYGDEVEFDRIGAWYGDDKREYPLGGG